MRATVAGGIVHRDDDEFVPLLAPTNPMTYDPAAILQRGFAIVAGIGAAALSFRLHAAAVASIPHAPPAGADVARSAPAGERADPADRNDWEGHVYRPALGMPDEATPLQRAQLLAALSVGSEIIRLRRIAASPRSGGDARRRARGLGARRYASAIAHLARLDQRLCRPSGAAALQCRARGSILAMSEALTRHAAYFDLERPMRFTEIDLFGVYVAPISVMLVGRLGDHDRAASGRRPVRPAASRLASGVVRVRGLHDRAVVDRLSRRAVRSPCPSVEAQIEARKATARSESARSPGRTEPRRRRQRPHRASTRLAVADHAGRRRDRRRARLGDVECLYGRAVDARRHGARLCRDDGAGGLRAHRRAAGRRQPVRPQGRSADGHRPDQLRIAVSLAEAAVQQAQVEHRRAERRSAEGQSAGRQHSTQGWRAPALERTVRPTKRTQRVCAPRRNHQQARSRPAMRPGAGQSRSAPDSLAGQRLGHQPVGAARRLRQCGAER